MKNEIIIIPFREEFNTHFRDLNIAWLEKYFFVEDRDREVLDNAKKFIIDKGGHIFFALYNNKVIGTVALMKEMEGYELSKMAVLPDYQGLKIGQLLLKNCINFAKTKGWEKLLLYSNTILENAIYIYKKFGFKEVELEPECPYQRSNIKMVLIL